MERINYIKPKNVTRPVLSNSENGALEGVRKVYKKIELDSSKEAANKCDINKNINSYQYVNNGDVLRSRRASNSSLGQSSTGSNQQSDKSLILVRKIYKQTVPELKSMGGKTYRMKIFKRDLSEKRETEETNEENKEEFCKYLGIDTKPPEKRVYRPEITNLDIFKRRSLRVRYLQIQSKTQCQEQLQGKFDMKDETTNESQVESTDSSNKGRPHDVKILRSYLKPKEKKTVNLPPPGQITEPIVLLKPIKKIKEPELSIKYLMRSKINLSESRLRSGLQKKHLLKPSRYLSYFKNKPSILRSRKDIKRLKQRKPVSKSPETTQSPKIPPTIELPKSPVSQVPDSTVNFQTPTHSLPIPTQVSTVDTMISTAHTLKNPLNHDDGAVLFAYVSERIMVIVQDRSVSFWRYSPFKHLVGVDQTWELIGRTKRDDYDIEIDCCKSDRICFNEKSPIYIEVRVTRAKDNENRLCPLSSVYVVVYSISSKQEFPGWTNGPVIKNFVQLDSVQSSSDDIHFIALPGTRYFIISWYQHLIQSKSSGLCKYSLTPDLKTLASIRDFPHVKHNIYDLKCFEDAKLMGFGHTELSIWNHITGDLLMSIDFKLSLGQNISIFQFKNEVIDCMFLTQIVESCPQSSYKSIKVLGINLSDDSWKVLKTHELPLTFNKCSKISTANTSNIAFCSIDNGQSLLMMSKNDLQWIKLIQMNHRTSDIDPTNVQLFFNGNQVVEIGENILIKSLDEFCLQM